MPSTIPESGSYPVTAREIFAAANKLSALYLYEFAVSESVLVCLGMSAILLEISQQKKVRAIHQIVFQACLKKCQNSEQLGCFCCEKV